MRYDFAPMEGLTDSVYRRLHHKYFGGVDRYFMPFLSPTIHRTLTHKEDRELPMADSVPFQAVPQILTKAAEDFLWAAQVCADRGYVEVNLNTGCPSGTVVAKGKGSGMLRDLSELDRFLDKIFSESPLPISVKTRLGLLEPEEFAPILDIYNRYPLRELIVHPRTRKQFYDGSVHTGWFDYAVENSKNPLCYNGDICSKSDISKLLCKYPQLPSVMIGRALIGDPGMLVLGGTDMAILERFLEDLLDSYTQTFGSFRNAMFRMKENWFYLAPYFDGGEKLFKALRKSTDPSEYRSLTAQILHTLPRSNPL